MINIKSEVKKEIKGGNSRLLKKVLEEYYDELKEGLVDRPSDQLEVLRGECRLLREIMKLL